MIASVETLRTSDVATAIRHHRLVAVLRRIEPRDRLLALVDELAADGVRLFEVTLDAPTARDDIVVIRHLLAGLGVGEAFLGAGTVRTRDDLEMATAAGADFGVSPVLDQPLMAAALDAGLPFVPGTATPSEADTAWRAGATFVKLFPGSSLGPSFVRELRGPLPEIQTIVTGGVDAAAARAFLAAGAVAVGMGSGLTALGSAARQALVAEAEGAAGRVQRS